MPEALRGNRPRPYIPWLSEILNPGVAFGAAMAGGAVGGFIGAFFALPIAATIQAFLSTYSKGYAVADTDLTHVDAPAPVSPKSDRHGRHHRERPDEEHGDPST